MLCPAGRARRHFGRGRATGRQGECRRWGPDVRDPEARRRRHCASVGGEGRPGAVQPMRLHPEPITRFAFADPAPDGQSVLRAFFRAEGLDNQVEGLAVSQTDEESRAPPRAKRAFRQASAPTMPPKVRIHDSDSEEAEEDEAEEEGPGDPLLNAMRNFQFQDRGLGSRSAGSQGASRQGLDTASSRSGGRRTHLEQSKSIPAEGSDPQTVNLAIQMEMLKVLQSMRDDAGQDGGEDVPAGHLDGLRISRNLSRMRSLEAQIEAEPLRTWRQCRARWVKLLGKEGDGFRWHDRNRAIKWKKYGGTRRVDFMLCQVFESLEQDRPEFARAQVVQCMKCTSFRGTAVGRAAGRSPTWSIHGIWMVTEATTSRWKSSCRGFARRTTSAGRSTAAVRWPSQ